MWEKLKIVSSSIWSFVLPFLKLMMTQAGPVLAAAALNAVKAVAVTAGDASDDQKRDMAFKAIGRDLERNGIKIGVDVSNSLIRAALEIALQKIKAG